MAAKLNFSFYSFTVFIIPIFIMLSAESLYCQKKFFAYHTKTNHTATDYLGKYPDLIVVIGKNQLEFTRKTSYSPLWVTTEKKYLIDNFFPEREIDYYVEYSYVRLIENSPEKIIVHWKYVPEFSKIEIANENYNPTLIDGLTNVVHEIYTIYPSGKVERKIMDGRETKFDDWKDGKSTHYQQIELDENGITYGEVNWADTFYKRLSKTNKNELKKPISNNTIFSFSFDEGGGDFYEFDYVKWKDVEEVVVDNTIDQSNKKLAPISGHGALYKGGVSGTSLSFDGYYTGVTSNESVSFNDTFTIESWIALDVYPFNDAPIIQKSKKFGEDGFYLGIDAYGHPFLTVNGNQIKSNKPIPLYKWTHISATVGDEMMTLYVNGEKSIESKFIGNKLWSEYPLSIGLNLSKSRNSDPVRKDLQNIPFIHGIQGLIDEVRVYNELFTGKKIFESYQRFTPNNSSSEIKKAILPGELGLVDDFSVDYKLLSHHELWDRMWRLTNYSDIVVKFKNNPGSIVYWHGTNYAANYVVDNNRWMADQSSEILGKHGCSEHMSDKQVRHSYARIIEKNPARAVIHWRHPCIDVAYLCTNSRNWSDEYHTIYPDGTVVRKVEFNTQEKPGFQDIQFFTNPGESPLDVVNMNAMTVANVKGDVLELNWEMPNKNPKQSLTDATIQWLNSKSEYKIFTIFQGPGLSTWGEFEQSKYTQDPFAGPWNHWPISLVPSDGRYAISDDRVTHFALGANDRATEFGSLVHYGFTTEKIDKVIPFAKYWQNPPRITDVRGGKSLGFLTDEKAFYFEVKDKLKLKFTINASFESPLINPAFIFQNSDRKIKSIKINDKQMLVGDHLKIGKTFNEDGLPNTIIWLKYSGDKKTEIEFKF